MPRVTVVCQKCGETVERWPSMAGKYCSAVCYHASGNSILTEGNRIRLATHRRIENCSYCKEDFERPQSDALSKHPFCSKECRKLGISLILPSGEQAIRWRGDAVGYDGVHKWIYRILGKAGHCDWCGEDKIPEGQKRRFHWSNISGMYWRKIEDWWQLCVPCHSRYDAVAHSPCE